MFPSSIKREIWHFHVVVMQGQQRNVQKHVMHMQSCCFANLRLLFFCRSRCHCHCCRRWLSCLVSSMRKLPTFHYATDGIPAKWHLRNEHRNSIMMMCDYPDLGSASDWSKIGFNQSEELFRSGFLHSFLRCCFTGKPLVILRDWCTSASMFKWVAMVEFLLEGMGKGVLAL